VPVASKYLLLALPSPIRWPWLLDNYIDECTSWIAALAPAIVTAFVAPVVVVIAYSVTNDTSLFGLDVDLDVHLLRLEAANTFSQIRRDVERNITTLKTLTPNSFGKRRSKDSFKDNVELVVNGAPESGALMPLVEKLGSDEPSINILILACFTLSKTTHANLEKHNLTNVFVEFLACVVNDCTIFPSMREKFIEHATVRGKVFGRMQLIAISVSQFVDSGMSRKTPT
ncbi:hypothetical protein QBC35DRAFT_552113, partial [Podospora australis]